MLGPRCPACSCQRSSSRRVQVRPGTAAPTAALAALGRLPWAGISIGERELAIRIAQVLESQDVCTSHTPLQGAHPRQSGARMGGWRDRRSSGSRLRQLVPSSVTWLCRVSHFMSENGEQIIPFEGDQSNANSKMRLK